MLSSPATLSSRHSNSPLQECEGYACTLAQQAGLQIALEAASDSRAPVASFPLSPSSSAALNTKSLKLRLIWLVRRYLWPGQHRSPLATNLRGRIDIFSA